MLVGHQKNYHHISACILHYILNTIAYIVFSIWVILYNVSSAQAFKKAEFWASVLILVKIHKYEIENIKKHSMTFRSPQWMNSVGGLFLGRRLLGLVYT